MKVELVRLDNAIPQRKIIAGKLPMTLGRDPEVGIHVADRWVSRRHCQIDKIDGTLVVEDLGSRHGTFVNGQQITEAHLFPDDKLTIGMSTFQVHYKRARRQATANVG